MKRVVDKLEVYCMSLISSGSWINLKRFSAVLLVIFLAMNCYADPSNGNNERQKRWEEMVAKRAAFFTERIGLTAEEAQAFWPVYNQLQAEKGKLNKKMHDLHHNTKKNAKGERMLDYGKLTDEMIRIKVQEANLDKIYHQKFKRILTPEKLFRFYIADREWGVELLKQIQKRGDPPKDH